MFKKWAKLISVFGIYILFLRLYKDDEYIGRKVYINHPSKIEDLVLTDTYRKHQDPVKSDLLYETATTDLKYILIFTPNNYPFHLLQTQQKSFIDSKCKYTNCYITSDRRYLKDLRDFNALLFSGMSIKSMNRSDLPKVRSLKQKYVFATLESAPLHPITNPMFDNFFNWTWTYRINSDISWKYITIYNLTGEVIGPAEDMIWPRHLKPIGQFIKNKLKHKTKAVAWFVSRCKTKSRREKFVNDFKKEFDKYRWSIDVYGLCGKRVCGERCSKMSICFKMLEKDYYFYFSFENSFDEDYVTEKLWIALNNFVVPVVFGGANYSRFLPLGSYLDARKLGPKKLAAAINDAIQNRTLYYEFFRWTNHFKYVSTEESTELCNICTALNNKEKMKKRTTYNQFRLWWNGPIRQKTYDFLIKYILLNDELINSASTYNYSSHESSLVLVNKILNKKSMSWRSLPQIAKLQMH